jgi:hypothetical protein
VDGDDTFLIGDDFTLLAPAIIDSVTVYSLSKAPFGTLNSAPGDEFSNISLYYGSTGSLSLSSSSYTAQLVTYQLGGETYINLGGTPFSIYALTFSGLNWAVNAGTYGFAVDATPVGGGSTLPLHASNAAVAGTPQDGADGFFRYYLFSGGAATFDSFCDTGDNITCGGWDKSSDINVVVEGSTVPEPGTMSLLLMGLGGLGLTYRKFGKR